MRILHINCNYTGTTLHQLMVEKLDALGYENQVYVPVYDVGVGVITPNANVCVSECFRKWDRLVFDYKQAKILRDIEARFDIASFDCIHAYTLFTDGNCAMRLSKKYGIPFVVAVRNTDVNAFFSRMIHLRSRGVEIMRQAKQVFFLSEPYRRQVFSRYVPEKFREELAAKAQIIPNGIDDFWFRNTPTQMPPPEDAIRLIYAGRIDKNKNIPTIQRAVRILKDQGRDARLTVVGRVIDRKEFDRIRADENTVCIDAQPKEGLIELYRKHDLFVMPSFTESFGLVYAEAMSQGLPVLYTQGQGFDGQFPEGQAGYRVLAGSPEDVAQKILQAYRDRQAHFERNPDLARLFQWDRIVERYSQVYRSLR